MDAFNERRAAVRFVQNDGEIIGYLRNGSLPPGRKYAVKVAVETGKDRASRVAFVQGRIALLLARHPDWLVHAEFERIRGMDLEAVCAEVDS